MTKDEALKLALEAYLCREMPAGTIIGDPKWWVPKIAMAIKEALAQPEQEPVATVIQFDGEKIIDASMEFFDKYPIGTELYTTPPHRKPLSDEEIDAIYTGVRAVHHDIDSYVFARAIEAAHGIKEG